MYKVNIQQGYRFTTSARDAELDFIDLTDDLMDAVIVDSEHDMVNVYKELYRKTIYGVVDTDYVIVPFFYIDEDDEDEDWVRVCLFETDMIDDGNTYILGSFDPDFDNDVLNICTMEEWYGV